MAKNKNVNRVIPNNKFDPNDWRSIINVAEDSVMLLDNKFRIINANSATADFLGRAIDEIIGKRCYKLFHNTDKVPHYCAFKRARRTKKREEKELYISEKKIWISVALDPVLNRNGNVVKAVHFIRDITSRKEKENKMRVCLAENQTLLKEVHHRVKNNLQIISSLINLQARKLKHEKSLQEAFRESQTRIRAIALVHEGLYQRENFISIDFRKYVQKLVSNLFFSYEASRKNIEFKSKINNIFLESDMAMSCGLIINELVSNSLKYAFLNAKKGCVEINFFMDKKNDSFSLIVEDDGCGFSEGLNLKETNSLGLRIVKTLTRQLGGSIGLDCERGSKFTVILKNASRTLNAVNQKEI
ncbi:MAG: PAS domain S-box protein [Candidatus Omnitrophica bacterium]|nr:PAS domain S-box protein [Candidatus Omnitrophota bacterium]